MMRETNDNLQHQKGAGDGREGEMMIDIISFIILIVSAIIGNVVIKKIDHKKSMIYLIWSIFICFLGCVLLYFRLM